MSNYVRPVITGIPNAGQKINKTGRKNEGAAFDKIFTEQLRDKEIKMSRHAAERIQQRNIEVSPEVRNKVGKAIEMAEKKGIKDSLVLTDNIAFVVYVNSKTIVTAIDKDSLNEKVFTNIDGAVYL